MNDAPAPETPFDRVTTVHEEIERWARERGGRPVSVSGPGGDEADDGRRFVDVRFPGEDGRDAEPVGWDAFFERFEEAGLAFAYDAEGDADAPGDACALVDRDRAGDVETEQPAETPEEATPERVGDADSGREADRRSTDRLGDVRADENLDAHRDEPPFES